MSFKFDNLSDFMVYNTNVTYKLQFSNFILTFFKYLKMYSNGLRVGNVPRGTIRDCAYTLLWACLFSIYKSLKKAAAAAPAE